jgi:putative peptidoglycan lipid II flippase
MQNEAAGAANATEAPRPTRGLAGSAGILALGGAASRVFGLLREIVIASLFGATGEVSAFRIAAQVPVLLYDLLVGGMLSAALVPVLSDYADRNDRHEFAQVTAVLWTLFGVGLALLVLLLEWLAPQIAWLLGGGFAQSDPALLQLTTKLIRVLAPALWLLGMAGLFMAILYSLQRFTMPSLAVAIYNLGIVLAAPLLAHRIGIFSLAVGILAGAGAQVVLMIVDLGRAEASFRLRWNFRHPALRRILFLYAPIAVGLAVSLFQVSLDRRLASGTGNQSIAWMANATTLQQMPLGLISVAISLAALPTLSRHFAHGDDDAYRQTLGRGLRLVILLIIPSAIMLWLLGEPIVRVLFQRNRFTPADTVSVDAALNIYVIGMIFAAIDFPLNYAFYARQNTLLPALVGIFSVGVYIAVALMLLGSLGYLGLVWADTAKQASHAVVIAILLYWRIGATRAGFPRLILPIILAAAGMAAIALAASRLLAANPTAGVWIELAVLIVTSGVGALVYAAILAACGVQEMRSALSAVRARLT